MGKREEERLVLEGSKTQGKDQSSSALNHIPYYLGKEAKLLS
jgi:hypothetical protein